MAYRLAPGHENLMIPGHGIVSSSSVLEGDLERFVALGLLVQIPVTTKAKPAKVAESLVEPAPAVEVSSTAVPLVDSTGGSVAPVDDVTPPVEDEIPPARKPETRKRR